MGEDFGVAAGVEGVAFFFEVCAEFARVEDVAVEDGGYLSVFVLGGFCCVAGMRVLFLPHYDVLGCVDDVAGASVREGGGHGLRCVCVGLRDCLRVEYSEDS